MTKYGLLSDTHSNLESTLKALKILDELNPDVIFHLGDVVGGFANPNEVIAELIKRRVRGVIGQHDESEIKFPSEPINQKSKNYLKTLERKIILPGEIILIHDNPLEVKFGKGYWGHGSYIRNAEDAKRVFEACNYRIIIVGHTHRAYALSDDREENYFPESGELNLDSAKRYVLNPGSVGFPKDGKTSSVAIYDNEKNIFKVVRF